MSLLKRIFGKPEGKNEKLVPVSPVQQDGQEEDDPRSFLDVISDFASQVNESKHQSYGGEMHGELPDLKAHDFPEALMPEDTIRKINELRLIIRSIESRPVSDTEITLSRPYKINYTAELNRAQLEAVTSINGPVLVIAGAGSGKTRVIVYRVAYMIENGVFPQDILLLTFTRKAAAEMIGRVQEILKENSVQKIFGGTFHSFSNYVLRKYANMLNLSSNFTIIDTEDSADTIDLIKSELKMVKKDKAFPKKHRIQDIISSSRNRNLTIRYVIENEFSGLNDFIPQIELIAQAYEKYKKICNLFDYDDLMDVLRDSLRDNLQFRIKMQQEYKYIMVDEYQDTNVVQKEIVELLTGRQQNVMIVGDDAQSIYSFRGANYENILRFPQQYPDCRVIKIEENYRSNQNILDFTNDIIRNAHIGYKKKLYSRIARQGLPFVKKFYDQQTEADYIVTKILEFREKGISLNQVAVLVRAFWHARYIEIELNRRGIPYVAVGGLAFNERKHVKDIISYLRIVQNPYDAVAWHRILKYLPGVGLITARKIIERINAEKQFTISSFENSKFAEGLKELTSMLNKASRPELSVSARIEIIKEYYSPILQATEHDYQVRLLDIDVLIDLSLKYESLNRFLTDFALDPPSKKFGDRSTPLIDETEDKPLTISTIHSAKGLEWYAVIIPHALDGLLPSVRALKNIEELEEERRLFYVACSRAKQELLITMPSYVATYQGFLSYPSRFLVEIEKGKYSYE
ncbi:MAG TPA: ATP-dependent helicase [Bacteroidales bacterium]|nr:ATP-dependent helicase [Bacteroidales bacterium]